MCICGSVRVSSPGQQRARVRVCVDVEALAPPPHGWRRERTCDCEYGKPSWLHPKAFVALPTGLGYHSFACASVEGFSVRPEV